MPSSLVRILLILLVCAFAVPGFAQADEAREELYRNTQEWAARQLHVASTQVSVAPLDGRVKVQQCSDPRYDFPFSSHDTIRVRCNEPAWQLYLRISVKALENAAYVSRSLPRGHIITDSDLVFRLSRDYQPGMFRDASTVIGRVLRREVRLGDVLLAHDLDDTIQVVRLEEYVRAGQTFAGVRYRTEQVSATGMGDNAFTDLHRLNERRAYRDLGAGEILLNDDVIIERQVVRATRSLSAGTILEPGLVALAPADRRHVPPDALASAEGIQFYETNRHVRSGEPLRTSDLRPAALVKRGQIVTLTVVRGGLQLVVKVEALHEARLGERINLRNPESQRVFSGIVTGRGEARSG